MTEQQTNEPEVPATNHSAGTILSAAREKLGIELADLAEQIRVPISVLEAIEKDRVPKNLPETFIRGYIRSYAKKVGVEESEVLTAIKTTAAFEMPEMSKQEMQSFSKRTKKQAFERRLKLVSWIILSVLVFALILWWYQDSNNTDIAPLAGGNADNPVVGEVVQQVDQVDINTQLTEETNNLEQGDSFSTVAEQTDVGSDVIDEVESNEVNGSEASTLADNEATQTETDAAAPIELTAAQTALMADIGEVDEEGFMKVEMLFENECWVEVYDINEERIAVGNKPAGYRMTLNAQGPFSVLLGNPVGVTIWVDGKKFDTDRYPRNRVARFELDAAELANN